MAKRSTRFVIKNSITSGATLPSSLRGEPIVNLNQGILYFSGQTGDGNFVNSDNPTSNYFEVGSNLNQLKLRDKIIEYSGLADVSGKFLSGTTNGFELADISSIQGVDSNNYVTGNTSSTVANKTTSTYFTTLDYNEDPGNGPHLLTLIDTFVTGGTVSNGSLELITNRAAVNPLTVNGTILQSVTGEQGLTATTTDGSVTVGIQPGSVTNSMLTNSSITINAGEGLGGDTSTVSLGGSITLSAKTDNSTIEVSSDSLQLKDDGIKEPKLHVTGGTAQDGYILGYDAGSTGFRWIDQGTLTNDTYVTGFTYDSASNKFTIGRNGGEIDLTAQIDSVSGLTVSDLTAGRVVYVGTGGKLVDEAGFTYNDSTNQLSTPSDGSMFIGTGGLVVGSGGSPNTPGTGDVVIHGDLTIFGNAVTASTGELYVEDNRITLNYNPTTGTSVTSLGSGWEIQDGSGNDGTDVYLRLAHFNDTTFTDIDGNPEYTSNTGAANRGLYTSLNDIVIRQSTVDDSPDDAAIGKRVLAEDDILDGGTY